jgi:Molybdate transporter of MFS superfamily
MPKKPSKSPKPTNTTSSNFNCSSSICSSSSNNNFLPWLNTRSRLLWTQLTVSEISGSVGDLGTFIPLVVAMARQDAIALSPALFWAGFANVVTGYVWDVPCAVQPMKAISAVAIAQGLTRVQVTTAGVGMGIFMDILCFTNGIEVINWLVPVPVCSGVQMGVGINLAIRGLQMIQELSWWDQLDCIGLALLAALFCLYASREPTTATNSSTLRTQNNDNDEPGERPTISAHSNGSRPPPPTIPVGLYLFGMGMLLALVHLFLHANEANGNPTPDSWFPSVIVWALKDATYNDWKVGVMQGSFPQLPLTTLNSVVSVCCLAHSLYPEKRKLDARETSLSKTDGVISRREMSMSVGLMNLVLCPLGAMPCCHGAGGLAGQHKFGARHGASVVFLGLNKMIIALFLGGSLLRCLEALPTSILGLMLVVCGHELAVMGWALLSSQRSAENEPLNSTATRKGAVVALLTVVVDVGLHKTHYAALVGWVAYMVYGDGINAYTEQVSYSYLPTCDANIILTNDAIPYTAFSSVDLTSGVDKTLRSIHP